MSSFRGTVGTIQLVVCSTLAARDGRSRRRSPGPRAQKKAALRCALAGARARDQALRLRRALLGVHRALQGRRGRERRQRGQQAEGRVLDGQDALQAHLLLGGADLLRSHRAKGARPRPLQRDPQVAGLAVARGGRLGRHPGEDRQVRPQGAGAARAGERARRALLPARQVPLQQGQVQRGGLALQHGADQQPVLRAGQAVRGRHPRARVQRQAGPRGLHRGAAGGQPRATTPR